MCYRGTWFEFIVAGSNNGGKDEAISPTVAADQKVQQEVNESCDNNNGNGSGNDKGESPNLEDSDLHGRYEASIQGK